MYGLDIKIDPETLKSIHETGLKLYVFKAAECSPAKGAKPLVWQIYESINEETNLGWKVNYGAYFSTIEMSKDANYSSITSRPISLGQTLVIDMNEDASVENKGREGAITIADDTVDKNYTCGISQPDKDGKMNPMCAVPLKHKLSDIIIPIEKIALIFASDIKQIGSVYEYAISDGVIIDFTNINNRTATFDLSKEIVWSVTDSGSPGEIINRGDDMGKLLITEKP